LLDPRRAFGHTLVGHAHGAYIGRVGAHTLPIFPLPVVLLPGAVMPLHIFEPRYRRMLAECLAGDRRFGLIHLPEGVSEDALEPGTIGCVAIIEQTESLPDGRANISVAGGDRFRFLRYVPGGKSYRVGEVEPFEDEAESSEQLDELADQLRTAFQRAVEAARSLSDDSSNVPELPLEPARLAFRIGSLIDIDVATRQSLLNSRSPRERLTMLHGILDRAIDPLERRAETHRRAKRNGKAAAGVEPGT